MFGKYNGFVSKARASACMYFLVFYFVAIRRLEITDPRMLPKPILAGARFKLIAFFEKDFLFLVGFSLLIILIVFNS
jgi:hypothetical protein